MLPAVIIEGINKIHANVPVYDLMATVLSITASIVNLAQAGYPDLRLAKK
jgi:hypothetical protein